MRLQALGILAIALATASGAAAQSSGLVIDRGRLDRPVDTLAPTPSPRPGPTASPGGPDAPGVALRSVRLSGVSADRADLALAGQAYVGRPLNTETIHGVADAVARALNREGLALYTVNVPPQDFAGGELKLQVIEGRFEQAVIHGAIGTRDMRLVRAYAAKLTAEQPLRRATLERYVLLIRAIPGLNPDIQLLQGQTPGGVVLSIAVKPQRVEAALGLDNRGSAVLDSQQATADLSLHSLLRQGDDTRLSLVGSLDGTSLQYVSLSHSQPIGTEGLRVQGQVGTLKTRARDLPLEGRATTAGLVVTYPLILGYTRSLYLSAGIDGLNSDNAIVGRLLTQEHTRVARASLSYGRQRPKDSVSVAAAVSLGIDGLGARTDPAVSQADFRKLTLNLGFDRVLAPRWTLRLRAGGQATGDAAPASEQFTLGGDGFGRGFEQAVLTGDQGAGGSAELAWSPKALPKPLAGSEVYVFGDAGMVRRNARPLFVGGQDSLSSAGLGVRVAVAKTYLVGLEGARPIDRPAGVADQWRLGLSLRGGF